MFVQSIVNLTFLEIIGLFFLIVLVIHLICSILRGIWTCFLANLLGFAAKWRTGDNVWAVVTGATDGIGLEYAKQLANIGYNLVIISRSDDKLKATEKLLQTHCKNCKKIIVIRADFNEPQSYDMIAQELNKLEEIHVLVNNIGTIYTYPEYYLKIPEDFDQTYFNLNIHSIVKMVRIVLPRMLDKRSGIVINITSHLAELPIPLLSAYCATKSYSTILSRSLSLEYQSQGVTIQTVLPNRVRTKLSTHFWGPLVTVSAEDYVRSALKTVGVENYTYGHWKHKFVAYMTRILIQILGITLFAKLSFFFFNISRHRYYKKRDNSL